MLSVPIVANYGFTTTPADNGTTIHYNRTPYGIGLVFAMLFPSFLLFGILSLWQELGLTAWIMLSLLAVVVVFVALNLTRKGGSFTVTKEAIEVDGKQYGRSHITDIYIKSPSGAVNTQPFRPNNTVFVGFGGDRVQSIGAGAAAGMATAASAVANAGAMASKASGDAIRKQYCKANHQVGFLYGERRVKLAGGLSAERAQALYKTVLGLAGTN